MPRFVPLSKRDDLAAAEEYETLLEGIPPGLTQSLMRWVGTEVNGEPDLLEIERVLLDGYALDWSWQASSAWEALENRMIHDDGLFLDVIDWLLSRMFLGGSPYHVSRPQELESILEQGRSVWKVAPTEDGHCQLERRLEATVAAAAEQVMSAAGRAGVHLRRAWTAVYGLEPSASQGYREAVRAIEAAAKPIVLPNDPKATLGQMIPALRDAPQKWTTTFTHGGVNGVDVVRDMMRLVWTAQFDRHGTDDESVPLDVSPTEAEAALHMATTLVHWFTQGAIATAT